MNPKPGSRLHHEKKSESVYCRLEKKSESVYCKYQQCISANTAIELRRKAYQKVLEWKKESNGETALLIEGMRRVGKSYLARSFGKREYKSCLIVDFSAVDSDIIDIFDKHSYDLDIFFEKLSASYGVRLHQRDSLVVFDEVQLYSSARQMIKRLVEDGRYDYIETGSLLSIETNVRDILLPSEEEKFELHPLDFEEFLWAMGDETSGPYMRQCFEKLVPLGDGPHKVVMNQFRRYMLVGGMPKVVARFAETKDFAIAEKEKRRILELYRNDIEKFAGGYKNRVDRIFDSIPSQLNRKEKRFMLSSISKNARMREYDDAFMWLADAMIVNVCLNSTDPTAGLAMSEESSTMKLYMADTGLLVTMSMDAGGTTEEDIYKGLLLDKIGINEGMFAENIVAQALRSAGHRLFFYSRYAVKSDDGETIRHAVEIDFLVRRGRAACPIEVKSSKWIRHESLDRFRSMFGDRLGQAYILCTKDVRREDGFVMLPLYMASLLRCI